MELRVEVSEDQARAMGREAERRGVGVSELLRRWVEIGLRGEMPNAPSEWMPLERWQALCRGENCALCELLEEGSGAGPWGYVVADLQVSQLWLARNQGVPGFATLVCRRHTETARRERRFTPTRTLNGSSPRSTGHEWR
jgi:hypothetical protein